jgi:hypothetical protein
MLKILKNKNLNQNEHKYILKARGLWAGMAWDLGISCLIRMSTLFYRLLQQVRRCWGPFLTQNLARFFKKKLVERGEDGLEVVMNMHENNNYTKRNNSYW